MRQKGLLSQLNLRASDHDNTDVIPVRIQGRTHLNLQLSSPLTGKCATRISPHSKSRVFVDFQNVLGVEDGPYGVDGRVAGQDTSGERC